MPGMLSRLYAYRERPSVSPLENFLTEAFAEFFERLPPDLKRSLLFALLPASARATFRDTFPEAKRLSVRAQVWAASPDSSKRPDIVVFADDREVVVIEAKVDASLQRHVVDEGSRGDAATRRIVRNQLETYARWIARASDRGDAWRGAVVLLTARTEPPGDFKDGREDGVARSTRFWRDVGDWILDEVPVERRDQTHCALAAELHLFLKERNLMTKYVTARDIAAASMFANSEAAFRKTFTEVLKAVGGHAPKLRGGSHYSAGFWSEASIYWAWFYFSQSVKKRNTRPFFAIGIRFEVGEANAADAPRLPKHEPFFFVAFQDDSYAEKASAYLGSIPEGWVEIEEGRMAVDARPVRSFSADPDERVEQLKVWAIGEVDKLVAIVPGYEAAKTEAAPAEDAEAKGLGET